MNNIKLKLSSFNFSRLKQTIDLIQYYYKNNNSNLNTKTLLKIVYLPKKTRHYCLLRSPHIDKCSREQFKLVTYKSFIILEQTSFNEKDLLNSIRIPSGVLIHVVKDKKFKGC